MASHNTTPVSPSPWVQIHAELIARNGRVLDLACGRGRHTRFLAALGFKVVAVDRDLSGVADLAADPRIELIQADLENDTWPFANKRFDGIVICNYLHRPHFPLLIDSLTEAGILIFDTFATGNERFGRPTNPDFLLRAGELLDEFSGALSIVAYEHGEVDDPSPAVRQRLCAIKDVRP
jgi:SAM-dependent methyltransferase